MHFDGQIPEKRPVDEGKAYGFCIFGPRNEWPNAVRFTLSNLLEDHKISYSKHSPEIKPLETRLNVTNNSAELFSIGETHLWKLLGRRLNCRSEKNRYFGNTFSFPSVDAVLGVAVDDGGGGIHH